MCEQFLGCMVSIKCVDDLGCYQGQIVGLNDQNVTIAKVFCNGIPHNQHHVTLRAKDIIKVDIIPVEDSQQADVQVPSKVTVKRPIAKRINKNSVTAAEQGASAVVSTRKTASDAYDIPNTNGKNGSEQRRKKLSERDEQAFGTPVDKSLSQDFDFEKNLALFNKEAVWLEINNKKGNGQQSQGKGGNKNRYRHDENVIESGPTTLRQIMVPYCGAKEYVTDDGLIIPSITLELHRNLIGAADRFGHSWERRAELLGRAGTELSLQLLGGAHRLNPNNAHQWPTVVVLCGPHHSGAAGVNCARQLSSHGVKTIVYVDNFEDISLLQEIALYRLTGHLVEIEVKKLPPVVDLIISTLAEENSPRNVLPVAKWASQNRASILAIEPPAAGTPGIVSKYSLVSALPLSHCPENGRLYLCNLALPNRVYTDVNIDYKSPFGPKFVIPLHQNNL